MLKAFKKHLPIFEYIIAPLVVLFIISIAQPNLLKARDKAKNREVQANIHIIQAALERYAVDHNGCYPAMIWGGDRRGWSTEKNFGCRTMWEHEEYDPEKDNNATARPPVDPLIEGGYLESYPHNPFLKKGEGLEYMIKWTGPENAGLGDGDPRFGYNGETMGNIIEDPRYLWFKDKKGKIQLSRIKNCFLDEAGKSNIGMVNDMTPANPFYSMGGIPEWTRFSTEINGEIFYTPILAYWPGEFFYRSHGDFKFPESFLDKSKPVSKLQTIWDFEYKKIDGYVLGGFGSMRTDGIDFLRLTDFYQSAVNNLSGDYDGGFYQSHPLFEKTQTSQIRFSSPEVFGGGGKGKMPYFPYTNPENGEWLYGAPDGYPDGIIICVTSSGLVF